MRHIVLTYNIAEASARTSFVEDFEEILTSLGLHKETTNQSTYYGHYRSPQEFLTDLHNAVSKMTWSRADMVTIYYPRVLKAEPKNLSDIGRIEFKAHDSNILNHIIYKG